MKKDVKPLVPMASVIRSKNAGPYELTLDVIFRNKGDYRRVQESGFFSAERIARLYSARPENVKKIIFFDPALALKITMSRAIVSGGPGDSDVYGAQQHAPLLSVKIPWGGEDGPGA